MVGSISWPFSSIVTARGRLSKLLAYADNQMRLHARRQPLATLLMLLLLGVDICVLDATERSEAIDSFKGVSIRPSGSAFIPFIFCV